jgi:putative transposase
VKTGFQPLQLLLIMLSGWLNAIKYECLNCMIFFGVASLERAIRNYVDQYRNEQNHQGIGNEIITPGSEAAGFVGEVRCRERLGGLLRYYYRKAA